MKLKRAFTLIEVLVAASVLFIVSAAVVGLSNSIIQGTAVTSDQATANRLATEGLELVTKIRDDTVRSADFSSGTFVWFEPVRASNQYGWYELDEVTANNWSLSGDGNDFPDNVISLTDVGFDPALAETISDAQIPYYRLICVEALAAETLQTDGQINCNTIGSGGTNPVVNDGDRQTTASTGECFSEGLSGGEYREDAYCQFTQPSLNRNTAVNLAKIIPDGNAIKIRSIVIWQDKDIFRTTQVTTVLTNWRSLAQ